MKNIILFIILLSTTVLFGANARADASRNSIPSPKIQTGKISGYIDCTNLLDWNQVIEEIKAEKPKTFEHIFDICDTTFAKVHKTLIHEKIKLTLFNDSFEKVLTADSGRFRNYTFTDIPFGEYMLKIEVDNYKPFKNKPVQPILQTIPLTLNQSEYKDYNHHEIVRLEPFAVNVSGTVLDEEGNPIPYAKITASYPLGPESGERESPVWKLTADSQGKYTIYGFENTVHPFFSIGFLTQPGEGEVKFGYGGTIDLSASAKGYVTSKPSRKLLLTENILYAGRLLLDICKDFKKVKGGPEMVENKKLVYPKSIGNTITGYDLILQKTPPYGTVKGYVFGNAKKDLYQAVDQFVKKDLKNEKDIGTSFFNGITNTDDSDKSWQKKVKVSLYSNDSLISVCGLDSHSCYRFDNVPYGDCRLIAEIANYPSYIRGETQTAIECQHLRLTPEKPVVDIFQKPAIPFKVRGRITDTKKNPVVNAKVRSYPDLVRSDSNGCYELFLNPDILSILATPLSEEYDINVLIEVEAEGFKPQYMNFSVADKSVNVLKQYYYRKTGAKPVRAVYPDKKKYTCGQNQTLSNIDFVLSQKTEYQ